MERLAFGLFALGLAFLSYLYGVASTRFELFPSEFVHDAWIGGKALYEVWAAEFDRKPPGAMSFEPGPARIEHAARGGGSAEPDRDLILVIGGA